MGRSLGHLFVYEDHLGGQDYLVSSLKTIFDQLI